MRSAAYVLSSFVALAACRDFDTELRRCYETNRCVDAGGGGIGGAGGGAVGGGGGGVGGGATRCPLRVTASTHHLLDGPAETRVAEPGPVSVLVPEGDGGYAGVNATGAAGSWCFEVPDSGSVLIRLGADLYVQTGLRVVDLSRWQRGRPGLTRVGAAPLTLEVSPVGPLNPPWEPDDALRLSSDSAFILPNAAETGLDGGETSAPRASFALSSATQSPAPGVPKASLGDVVHLIRTSHYDALTWRAIQYAPGAVEADPVGTASIDAGPLMPLALRPIALRWIPPTAEQRFETYPYDAGFDAGGLLLGQLGLPFVDVNLWADPHDAGYQDPTAFLAFRSISPIVPTDVAFDYGNPFRGSVSLTSLFSQATPYFAPGVAGTLKLETFFFRVLPHDTPDAGVLEFGSPPRGLALNGAPIQTVAYGALLTQPIRVSWQQPSTGAPSQYRLELFLVAPDGTGGTAIVLRGNFYVPGDTTALTVPPLTAGRYAVRLTAVTLQPYDPAVPLRPAPSRSEASALTRAFDVP